MQRCFLPNVQIVWKMKLEVRVRQAGERQRTGIQNDSVSLFRSGKLAAVLRSCSNFLLVIGMGISLEWPFC